MYRLLFVIFNVPLLHYHRWYALMEVTITRHLHSQCYDVHHFYENTRENFPSEKLPGFS